MAKVKPDSGQRRIDLQHRTHRIDDATKDVFTAVTDEQAAQLLQQILAALGGSSDTTSTINIITITNANDEVSFSLPANTKGFLVRSRNKGTVKLAYVLGETTGNDYLTIPVGSSYKNSQFYSNQTIYIASNKAGDVIEIETHT